MARAISLEVREKIVSAYKRGLGTQEEIADMFDVTRRTVSSFINKALNDDLNPKKQTGRPGSIDHEGLNILKDIVLHEPDKTLSEYCVFFEEETDIFISRPVMCRALKKLKLRRKKKSFYAQEQGRPDVKKKDKILLTQ